jgi:predicted membrane protein
MFLAIVFIVIGLFLLLNAMGIIAGNFWGFLLAIIFIAIGAKMMMRGGRCPMCEGIFWQEKMHGKIHERMHDHCNCGHEHQKEKENI